MSILPSLIEPISSLLDKFVENKDQKNLLAHRQILMMKKISKTAWNDALASIKLSGEKRKRVLF